MANRKNLAKSLVATAPSPAASGTSLVVTTGHGTRFPSVPFWATIQAVSEYPDPTNAEIVQVTNVATDTLTIVRAQQGTSARTVIVGDVIANTITVDDFSVIEGAIDVVSNALSVETAARVSADNALSTQISVLSAGLSNETSARVAGDNALSQAISVVSQALSVAFVSIAVVSNAVSAEASMRLSADNQLSNTISVETAARISADNALSDRISIVSQAVSAGDAGLSVRIDTQSQAISVISQQVSVLSQAHSALSQAVSVADAALSVRIDTQSQSISALSQAHSATSARLASVMSLLDAGTTGQVLKKQSNTDFDFAWDTDLAGGSSSATVTSANISALSNRLSVLSAALSTQISAISQAHSALSQAVSVADAALSVRIDTQSQAISVLSQQVSVLSATGHIIAAFQNVDTSAVSAGAPVYAFTSAHTFKRANASAIATKPVLGLVIDSAIAVSALGRVQTGGYVTLTTGQWDNITGGTGGLTAGSIYYLDVAAGLLTLTAPTTGAVRPVGVALSTTVMQLTLAMVDDLTSAVNVVSNAVSALSVQLSLQISAISQAHSALSQAVSVADAALSVRVNTVSQQVSVLSQQVSVLSQAVSVADAALSVRIDTQSQAISVLSQGHSVLSAAHVSLVDRVSGISAAVSSLSADVTSVKDRVSGISAAVSSLSADLTSVKDRLSSVSSLISTQISAISQAHSALSQAVSVADAALSVRIDTQSQSISVISQQVSALSQVVSALSVRVDGVSDRLSQLTSAHNALSNTVSALSVGPGATDQYLSLQNQDSVVVSAGAPVYLHTTVSGFGSFKLADASAISAPRRPIGLVVNGSVAISAVGTIRTRDSLSLTTAQWDNITSDTGGLSAGAAYYLHTTRGRLTQTMPTGPHAAVIVGYGVTTTEMRIAPFGGVADWLSDSISVGTATAADLSNKISALSTLISTTASALSVRVDTVSNLVSALTSAHNAVSQAVSVLSAGLGEAQMKVMADLQSISGTGLVKLSGMSVILATDGVYEIEGMWTVGGSSLSIYGVGLSIQSGTISIAGGRFVGNLSIGQQSGPVSITYENRGYFNQGSFGSVMYSALVSVTANKLLELRGLVVAGTAGTIQLKAKAGASGTVTFNRGGFIRAYKIG